MSAPDRPGVHAADPVRLSEVYFSPVERPIAAPVRMSFGALNRRVMAVVGVMTADGTHGFGESWANFPPWILAERQATVVEGIRPVLLDAGLDLLHPESSIAAAHEDMVRSLWPMGRQWGAPGSVMQAISGSDQALWDLAGQLSGKSVSELVGGYHRQRVPVYASGIGPDDVTGQVRRCRQVGFSTVKLRVGFDPGIDKANLLAARRALGDSGELLVDANQAWSLDDAVAMADMLVEAGVSWVEEPIADGTIEDWMSFHNRTGLDVAVGENVYGRRAWSRVLASPGIAVVQPDVSKQGGITELLWLCRQAEATGKIVEPHLYGGALAYAATLQVAACSPAVRRVELDVRSNPVRDELLVAPPVAVDGHVEVPEGAGLGVMLVEEVRRRIAGPKTNWRQV